MADWWVDFVAARDRQMSARCGRRHAARAWRFVAAVSMGAAEEEAAEEEAAAIGYREGSSA